MIDDFSDIVSLFKELDGHLERDADVFLIGGGALMRYGLRDETKDIDIIVSAEDEYGTSRMRSTRSDSKNRFLIRSCTDVWPYLISLSGMITEWICSADVCAGNSPFQKR